MGFVNLHNHTEYSKLDGAQTINEMVKRVKEMGQTHAVITDHDSMGGIPDLLRICGKEDIKPIIGVEAYIAPDIHRSIRSKVQFGNNEVSGNGSYGHITLLAQNETGIQNLQRMRRLAWGEGFYRKPRIDMELLERFSDGVIAFTGCPSGMPQTYLRMGWYEWAISYVSDLKDIFDNRLYVELMDHGLEIETKVKDGLLRIARELSLPLVATNDCHYSSCNDVELHDALLCLQTKTNVNVQDRMQFRFNEPGLGYHLASEAEMLRVFSGAEEAVTNTQLIADSIQYNFQQYGQAENLVHISDDPFTSLTQDTWSGAVKLYGESHIPKERIQWELDLIRDMGYVEYFLVTAEYVNWARNAGIGVGPARGSGAASAVAYCIGITQLDPIELELPMERFINPERPSMPDFDVDFAEERRGEVYDHVIEKYGEEYVAKLETYSTFKPRSAIEDAAKVLGYPYDVSDALKDVYPQPKAGFDVKLSEVFDPDHSRYAEGAEFRKAALKHQDVLQLAKSLEGRIGGTSVHPCAVMLSKVPLTDLVPVHYSRENDLWVIEGDVQSIEDQGLIKHDFLGLKELSVIDKTLQNVERHTGVKIELPHRLADLRDEPTLETLRRGDSLGCFQLDSEGMRALLRNLQPTKFLDLSAVVALYRPGPMGVKAHISYADRKNGREDISYLHPEVEDAVRPILEETYGLIVYQEQVMRLAQTLSGYTLGEADILRRIMGKKKRDDVDGTFVRFEQGMKERGYSDEAILTVWGTIVPFADYSFNKSHSAGYALIGYWGAYLKTHHPAEYIAAQMSVHRKDRDKVQLYLAEATRLGIKLTVPDISTPSYEYFGIGKEIRMGLGGVKGVASDSMQTLVSHGGVQSLSALDGLCEPNKTTMHRIAMVGATDRLYPTREAAVEVARLLVAARKKTPLNKTITNGSAVEHETSENTAQHLAWELEYLNRYVSSHPCELYRDAMRGAGATPIAHARTSGKQVVAGVVQSVQHRVSKTGNNWGIIVVDDGTDTMNCNMFPNVYKRYSGDEEGHMVVIGGEYDTRDGNASLNVRYVEPLDLTKRGVTGYVVTMNRSDIDSKLPELRRVCDANKGLIPIFLELYGGGRDPQLYQTKLEINPKETALNELMAIGQLQVLQ